jgi:hypothetical protein
MGDEEKLLAEFIEHVRRTMKCSRCKRSGDNWHPVVGEPDVLFICRPCANYLMRHGASDDEVPCIGVRDLLSE